MRRVYAPAPKAVFLHVKCEPLPLNNLLLPSFCSRPYGFCLIYKVLGRPAWGPIRKIRYIKRGRAKKYLNHMNDRVIPTSPNNDNI